MKRPNRNGKRKQRQEAAAARQAAYNALTPDERLARSIERGGENSREATRLAKQVKA